MTCVVAFAGVEIVAVPLISDQVPIPSVGVIAASVADDAQTVWLIPGSEGEGGRSRKIETESLTDGHTPFVTVHVKVFGPG